MTHEAKLYQAESLIKQQNIMKTKLLLAVLIIFIITNTIPAQSSDKKNKKLVKIELKNPLNIAINDAVFPVPSSEIKKHNPAFNPGLFCVKNNSNPVNSEFVKDYLDLHDVILINISLAPNETKTLWIYSTDKPQTGITKRTQAHLGQKTDYKRVDKFYKEGKFSSVTFTKVPSDHFAHDALYQFEGPGWESDKVAYRFYLDDRNRTDIFGKITDKPILNIVGINDLDSGNEGYQNPQEWGMDIFKVGNSLGIGSIATFDSNKVFTVSVTDSTTCHITNNKNLFSSIRTNYYGWKAAGKKYDLTADLSIIAGSRLTRNDLSISGNIANICTGIAKHENTEYLSSSKDNGEKWGYIALYGKQSRDGNNLGLAVFYKKSDLIKTTENEDSHLVLLKPEKGNVTYYFSAAWEKEANGIKSKDEFVNYLNETCKFLSSKVKVSLKPAK